jgi:DNA-binding HxlR family transcriptional regulator
MKQEFRCDCPVTSALDIVGDKWMLVIVKQMLIEGMQTFKDFTESDEAIATNILSSKLKCLEQYGLIKKTKHPTNRKINIYRLTESGLSLAPIVVEIAIWSDQNMRRFNPVMRQSEALESMKNDKEEAILALQHGYRQKSAVAE